MLPFSSVGHEEVMFIHTHYSHLSEILSGAQEPPLSHQEKGRRLVNVCLF